MGARHLMSNPTGIQQRYCTLFESARTWGIATRVPFQESTGVTNAQHPKNRDGRQRGLWQKSCPNKAELLPESDLELVIGL